MEAGVQANCLKKLNPWVVRIQAFSDDVPPLFLWRLGITFETTGVLRGDGISLFSLWDRVSYNPSQPQIHCMTEGDLELLSLLPQPSKFWKHRPATLCPASFPMYVYGFIFYLIELDFLYTIFIAFICFSVPIYVNKCMDRYKDNLLGFISPSTMWVPGCWCSAWAASILT